MFSALGAFVVARRRWVLIGTLIFLVFAGVWGAGAFSGFSGSAGFDDPGSQSSQADALLAGPLGTGGTDVVVLYQNPNQTVDDPQFAAPVQKALASVPRAGVARLDSYWTTHDPAYVSADKHSTYVEVQFRTTDDPTRITALRQIKSSFAAPGFQVRFGGYTAMIDQINAQTSRDIGLAEGVSLPILFLLLILMFRSLVAASLPLAVGITAAVGSLAVLRGVMYFVDLYTFAINVVTILGLGLAIDYALLMVNRFREELAAGRTVEAAVRRTVSTAGRTVVFSGLAVAISFIGLALFPSRFLESMGYAGVATVLFAVISSLTVLPALLRVVGTRVNSLRIPLPRRRSAAALTDERQGRWYKIAQAVMRRPLVSTVGIVVVLVLLGTPFLGVNWARPGDWVLPVNSDARAVTQVLGSQFTVDPSKTVTGVVTFSGAADTSQAADFAQRLGAVDGVTSAKVTGSNGNLARVTLGYRMDPMSPQAETMVRDIRSVSPPAGTQALFTGMPASRVDIQQMIVSRLPWLALFVALVSFVVMFLAFGSVVLPLKSLVMNLLSLSASFGAIKLIFQDGWLSGPLNFVPVGAVDINFPVLIVAVAFALSMDYEVFLLSRVREQYARTGDTTESMALGLQRTAKIITSAALLLVVVTGGFVLSQVTLMKMIGVGLVIAIVVDATIVRGLLVPATMRLLGKWAWWAPAPMARWWQRHGIREDDEPDPVAAREPVAV
ncbi:MMPL family transporter [Kutzneria sp. CA-103260]|uniref:MMPL family transporter n=1 Tax=Kutzneria sp. CA-103260 TaxID=2802641 RepID=UPI001BAD9B69|nr:MMPL family transporter [Kutzneria sp. CA-103260]